MKKGLRKKICIDCIKKLLNNKGFFTLHELDNEFWDEVEKKSVDYLTFGYTTKGILEICKDNNINIYLIKNATGKQGRTRVFTNKKNYDKILLDAKKILDKKIKTKEQKTKRSKQYWIDGYNKYVKHSTMLKRRKVIRISKILIHQLDLVQLNNGNARYLCNQAVYPTPSKLTTNSCEVTCKNCLQILKSLTDNIDEKK